DARAAAHVMLAALRRQGTAALDDLLAAHKIQMGSYSGGVRRDCRYRGAPTRKAHPEVNRDADPDNPFYGLTVCFTGSPHGMKKDEAAARIAALGARTVRDVTKAVDLLVVGHVHPNLLAPGAKKTGKLAKAERLRDSGHDITVIVAEEVSELLAVAEGGSARTGAGHRTSIRAPPSARPAQHLRAAAPLPNPTRGATGARPGPKEHQCAR